MEYKELTELLAFVKSEEQYIKRIEELKHQEMKLAHVRSIATTIEQADMIMADAKEKAKNIVDSAINEANEITAKAEKLKQELLTEIAETKTKQKELKEATKKLEEEKNQFELNNQELEKSIADHRTYSSKLQTEITHYQDLKKSLDQKFLALKHLMLS